MADKRKYADRATYIKRAVAKRRSKLRLMAREYKGGKCIICGYKRHSGALEFHHLDPQTKEFGISVDGSTRSWARIKAEADKCVLVCANCHREIHGGITQLPKETLR